LRLRIVHRTSYLYSEPVTTSYHEARLAPRDTENQRSLAHELVIAPVPGGQRRRFDYFGNRALHFSLSEPHRALDVIATSTVDLSPLRPPLVDKTPSWEAVQGRLRSDRRRDVLDACAMSFDSPHVAVSPAIAEYAAPSFTPGRPALAAVRELCTRIHADFKYDPRATEVSTPLEAVLAQRSGVCQDFAHLAIACLRAQGLAARYVSGYLLTRPPEGRTKLVGADASHAWFSTFIPDAGWFDFDPTNDLMPEGEHVTVAFGRDFSDVTPMRGVILGGGKHELRVAVDVHEVPAA
jgi:transglutaminase-like putative cysteine protease